MPSLHTCPNCLKTVFRDRLRFPTLLRPDGTYEPADDVDVARGTWLCRCCTNRIRALAGWSRDNGVVWPVGAGAAGSAA